MILRQLWVYYLSIFVLFIFFAQKFIWKSFVKIFEGNITFMNANETESNTFFSKTYDTKYIRFVNKVLKESADSFEKEQKCTYIITLCDY